MKKLITTGAVVSLGTSAAMATEPDLIADIQGAASTVGLVFAGFAALAVTAFIFGMAMRFGRKGSK